MASLILKMSVSLDGYVAPPQRSTEWSLADRPDGYLLKLWLERPRHCSTTIVMAPTGQTATASATGPSTSAVT